MAAVAQNTNNMTIRSILQQEKLTGPNFMNWYQNLRIILRSEGKLAYLEQPLIPLPYPVASQAARDAYNALYDSQNEVACLMLGSISPELQRALENYKAYDMIQELKTMFKEQAKQELFETVKAFHACKQVEGQSISSYLLKMKSYLDTLERLGKTIAELHVMLKLHEKGAKGKDKGKNKLAYAPKPKILPLPKRVNPAKESNCHHYKEVDHWRKNYPSYQAKLKKRKNASVASTSGIFTIELYDFPNKTWVYDTGCGTHICNTSQGLRGSRKSKHEALSLYMGNGMRTVVEAIGSFDLVLPSGLIIIGHINKKRMDKLQRDGILQPTHDESLKKCKSCISRKMTHKPFPHQVERAKDLLGLIHIDNEVENQLSKKIKAIRSDRGGEYLSHKFVDHMKSYGIVSQLTPPYTPQHNENSLMVQEASGSHGLLESSGSDRGLELIQEEDTQPFKNTSEVHNEVAPIKVEPQNVKVLIRRSARIPQAPHIYGFNVDVEEYELGDLNEPPNYKAALSDLEFEKWLKAMNTIMQS
ncbi:zinc finger, CCHC-type containing protein, partial [Tanacetum coccineum]